jgi:hypothetical protein
VAPALSWAALRSFASGTYLDKAQVTDRVMSVVKNFSKVDPAKARRGGTRRRRRHLPACPTDAPAARMVVCNPSAARWPFRAARSGS